MTRHPRPVPEPDQLNLLDNPDPPVQPDLEPMPEGLSADEQVAWAEQTGDDIPFWTVAA